MIWESLIIVSVILVFFFTRNENKKREERERIEEERVIREEERVIREENEREERVIREQERIEEEREKIEQERLVRKKELEEKRKKKEFWFGLDGLETEDELNKVFEKLGFETELTPPSNDEGIDHVLNGEIVVQTKNTQNKVSRPDLQRFWGSWKDSHKKGIFVSIHGFSNTCEEFVKDKPILLYDVDDVIGMSEGKKPEWNE
jgi:restriction endonuclease Mrr